MRTFWGEWCCEASMRESFGIECKDYGLAMSVIFAAYSREDYEGEAYVILYCHPERAVYEVHGYHCSCFGLEDQWKPEKTPIDALSIPSFLGKEELATLRQIVDKAVTKWGAR